MTARLSFSPKQSHKVPISQINVTPMVDVMLVLLIVFMITAPLLTVGVPVNLPEAGGDALQEKNVPLTITINEKGEVFLQEARVEMQNLVPRLQAIAGEGYTQPIYVRGDTKTQYGNIAKIMSHIHKAGFSPYRAYYSIAGNRKIIMRRSYEKRSSIFCRTACCPRFLIGGLDRGETAQ